MLRFNDTEYDQLRLICESFDLDISERGTISPLLRRLVLQQETEEKDMLPNISNLAYHINKVGNNINQLVKIVHQKNLRSPNSSLKKEIQRTNELLHTLVKITMEQRMG